MEYPQVMPDFDIALAKLAAPPLPPFHIPRLALFNRFVSCLPWKIILVAAPKGQGKTTALSEWYSSLAKEDALISPVVDGLEELSHPLSAALWLTLDQQDAEPRRLWGHMVAALSQQWPDVVPHNPLPSSSNGDAFQQFLTGLSNFLFRYTAGSSGSFTLFLDNADTLPDQALASLLRYVADSFPSCMRVVVAGSNVDTPLLGCFRDDIACIIPSRAFSFDTAETLCLLTRMLGSALAHDTVDVVETLAAGWVTGIRLCATTVQEEGLDALRHSLRSSELAAPIDRYFAARVSEGISDDFTSFLLETSIVDIFCPALCDRITARSDGQKIIEELIKKGFFLEKIPGEKSWYTYRPLFLRWLRNRMLQLQPSQIRALNHEASEWFEAHDRPMLAAKHLLMASDFDLVEQLAISAHFVRESGDEGFILWASAIPADDFVREPLLSLLVTWAYVLCGRPSNALSWLEVFLEVVDQQASEQEAGAGEEVLRAATLMAEHVRIKCQEFSGQYAQAIRAYGQLLEDDNGMSLSLRSVVVHALGESYERVGDFARAQECFLESEAIAEMTEMPFFDLFSRYESCWIEAHRGDLNQAQDCCFLALRECPNDYTLFGSFHSLLAYVQIEMNRLDEAKVSLQRAFKRLSSGRNADMLVEAKVVQSYYLQAVGNYDAAYKTILQAVLQAESASLPRSMLLFAYVAQARIELSRDNLAGASFALRNLEQATDHADALYAAHAHMIGARIHHFQGELDKALSESAQTELLARKHGLGVLLLESLLFQATTLSAHGKKARAFSLLNDALMEGSRQGAVRAFLHQGEPLRALLHEVTNIRKTNNGVRTYAKKILSAFGCEDTASERSSHDKRGERISSLAVLTGREREVLDLLNAGMARQEIADELGVSVNTIKTHLNNIYVKLGVDNRIDAFRLVGEKDSP